MDEIPIVAVRADPGGASLSRLGLSFFLVATACCLSVGPASGPTAPNDSAASATDDFQLYRRVVERVAGGEPYYEAAQRELRTLGYPSRSVFNWRTPIYAWFLGRWPGLACGRWILLAGMALGVLGLGRGLAEDFGAVPAVIGGLFLVGATSWCVGGEAVFLLEFWAAMLITVSAAAYRFGWTRLGAATGLLAIFYRELALPYALVSAGLAVYHGRKREAVSWAVGLALFAAFLACHAAQVHARLTGDDLGMPDGWVRFGGLRFVLATARTNVFLAPLPGWCTALYLPLAAIGLAGGRGEAGWRMGLTAALFLGAFSVVGKPFNFYWGFINAPFLAVGIAGAPKVLGVLISRAIQVSAPSPPFQAARPVGD